MILDKQLMFSEAQAVTADAGSTNVIDTQSQAITTTFNNVSIARDVGNGLDPNLRVFASVTTTFLTVVSMSIQLQTDTDVAFGSAVILWTSRLFLLAELVAGFQFLSLPSVPSRCKRYLRLFYDVNTSATAGNITAGLVLDRQLNPVA